jgi:hypothetical protein
VLKTEAGFSLDTATGIGDVLTNSSLLGVVVGRLESVCSVDDVLLGTEVDLLPPTVDSPCDGASGGDMLGTTFNEVSGTCRCDVTRIGAEFGAILGKVGARGALGEILGPSLGAFLGLKLGIELHVEGNGSLLMEMGDELRLASCEELGN